jgi:hypothetical protein
VLGWVGCPTFEVKNPFELNYCQVYSTYSSWAMYILNELTLARVIPINPWNKI